MIGRSILAAVLFAGTAGAALAQAGVDVQTPGERPGVDLDINVGARMAPTDDWVGRAVYSTDNKHLGEVAGISGDQIYVDIGGFLGLGETRVLLDDEQIGGVEGDRIVLKLTEAEAKALPAADDKAAR